LGKIMLDQARNMLDPDANLKARIKGQNEATGVITEVIL